MTISISNNANLHAFKSNLNLRFSIKSPKRCFLLMVEFIEVLHVAKDDVLLIDDSWRNLLNSTGHLPQVGLQ